MATSRSDSSSAVLTAIICAGLVTAQFVAGKAVRDTLFLAYVGIASLPAMIIGTSIFSIALVAATAKGVSRLSPPRFVSWAFAISAALLIVEWALISAAPKAGAVFVYLHISGLGPILGSGFWLVATERFDPRTAKRKFGQIAGGGTLGGLLGGLVAERIAVLSGVGTILPILAVLNVMCAWQVRRLVPAPASRASSEEFASDLTPASAWVGLRVLSETPYLRHLALLVLLSTTGAALIDYAFKVQAVATLGSGESLLRFFAVYYAAVSLVTFAVQTSMSQFALERLGLAVTSATPSLALFAGGVGSLVAPGLQGVLIARGGESVFRGSLFRAAYEVFYTPLPSAERRAAKTIIDVGFDRAGDAVGGGIIRFIILLALPLQHVTIIASTLACSALAIVVASRLTRGYIQTLERNLRERALALDMSQVTDLTTRTTMLQTLMHARSSAAHADNPPLPRTVETSAALIAPSAIEPEVQDIIALRSRNRDRTLAVLRRDKELSPALIPDAIRLLAWDPVVDDVIRALRIVAPSHVGALTDALLDPYEDFAVRRRIPRVMSGCRTQRAVDSLLLGLADTRFEVRFQCGRSLKAITAAHPNLHINETRIFDVVRREVAVGRPVWEGHRLLDRLEDGEAPTFVDDFVRMRASQSLSHVFTVLSLVLPSEPLQIAFRGLHADDQNLRGTALEYLESILPPVVRDPLWPFLEDHRPAGRPAKPRQDILADLLRSNHSIMLNLEEIKRRSE